MIALPAPLAPLAAYRQFVVCQFVPDLENPGKTHKYPIDITTGKKHDAHDPAIWLDVDTAIATAAQWGAGFGIGFTFTENDPFFFIDVDNCVGPDGQWTPIVAELCGQLNGAAVEVSNSQRGLHIIGTGSAPKNRRKKDYTKRLFDLYTEKRFVALTGLNILGNAAGIDHTPALHAITEKWLKLGDGEVEDGVWTIGPCEGWYGPTDDDELIARAMRSQSTAAAFSGKASFRDLFERNVEALSRTYPDDQGQAPYDDSAADQALAQHLAFWTGKDCERILRLMMRSELRREKWNRPDYLRERTIPNAIRMQREVLCDKTPEPLSHDVSGQSEAPVAQLVSGSTFIGIDEQIKLFSGCVYVVDQGRILTPGGMLLKPEQFKVIYGGYTFNMDNTNDRTSRDAYEAFTQNQAYRRPTADSMCFKPDRAPGEIIRDAGRSRVNTWWPVDVPREVGDVTPFLIHLAKLLPNERDREILLAYMCACVQHKGFKFQWAPLLQGVEGNGKTLLTRCVAEAVGRRYVHWPKASKLAKEFNSWMLNKLFYGVEDIYVPDSKREVIEELKPMITGGDGLEIEGKGVDQISADVCGNFMFNSNHKDAIRKTRNDRRFAVFYTAQQHAADLVNDGMTGDYFPNLYEWLREGGYAIVSELLHTRPIPDEFNPATACQRAPDTTSTEDAISSSMGGVEQEINEAIAQGLPGFAGGWVSSMALDKLLERINRARSLPLNKRRELLDSLGYMPHPGLKDGRVTTMVHYPDNGKPILFIRKESIDRFLSGAAEVVRAYTSAQGPTVFSQA